MSSPTCNGKLPCSNEEQPFDTTTNVLDPSTSIPAVVTLTPSPSLAAFFARQRALLEKERNTDASRTHLLLTSTAPKILEKKGLALTGLAIVNVNVGILGGKTLVEIERSLAWHISTLFPPNSFRNGDLVKIEGESSANKKVDIEDDVTGVVYKITDSKITIALDNDDAGLEDLPGSCRVLKLANSVTYDRMDKAIDTLEKISVSPREPLVQVLLGLKPLSPSSTPPSTIVFFDPNLNDSQKSAIQFCLDAPEVACIHGPPGTGKTHTLIELIRQLTMVQAKRVLVCGASNLAVDNILERLLALPERPKVTRVGHPARVMGQQSILDATLEARAARTDQAALVKDVKQELDDLLGVLTGNAKSKGKRPRGAERRKMWDEVNALRKELRKRSGSISTSVLKDSQVVLSTCHSAGGKQLDFSLFDVLIIDEATQAMEAVTWVPIFKAKKLILAGDPMQLPPTVLSRNTKRKKKSKQKAAEESVDLQKGDSEGEEELGSDVEGDSEFEELDEEREASPPEPVADTPDAALQLPAANPLPDPSNEEIQPEIEARARPQRPSVPIPPAKPRNSPLVPPSSLEVTLFERLEKMYGARMKRMLSVQYRMHANICAFPSQTLYGGKLRSDKGVEGHLLSGLVGEGPGHPAASPAGLEGASPTVERRDDPEEVLQHPIVFFDTSGCEFYERLESDAASEGVAASMGGAKSKKEDRKNKKSKDGGDAERARATSKSDTKVTRGGAVGGDGGEGSKFNENEATIVKNWVNKLVEMGVGPGQIAVITPYQAQVTHLTTLLRPMHGPDLEIGTVDGMQGREKEAVIISLVRSNNKREVGFLKEKRRLNVAMTRARRHLCVVGDASTVVHGGAYLKKWMEWLEANADVRFPEV